MPQVTNERKSLFLILNKIGTVFETFWEISMVLIHLIHKKCDIYKHFSKIFIVFIPLRKIS